MRNSCQRPGCMRRFPASHSCHPRRVQWMSAAAAVCESPAASRAARISVGAGFLAGLPARLRFGWFAMMRCLSGSERTGLLAANDCSDFIQQGNGISAVIVRNAREVVALDLELSAVPVDVTEGGFSKMRFDLSNGSGGNFVSDLNGGHFQLLPLSPEARLWRIHNLNNTRIACNCKNFLRKIYRGSNAPHN